MRTFTCTACGQLVFFENSACLSCGRPLGFDDATWSLRTFDAADDGTLLPLDGAGASIRCANAEPAACNWVVELGGPTLCQACALTRTRPDDGDPTTLAAFAAAEAAKRRLLYQLHDLRLPVTTRADDPEHGLAFDLLSSRHQPVTTGHDDGVITLDLAESDDAHRTQVQQDLGEPYRTVLGHFRHEIGHYYWGVLVEPDPALLAQCRQLFGDDSADYADAVERHYAGGPPQGWEHDFVSGYATMHPYEDWAETFAHLLHILDTLQTAAAYGMVVTGPQSGPVADLAAEPRDDADRRDFTEVLEQWLPLTYALNAVNRSMGQDDLYPFVLAPAVVAKLSFVHDVVRRSGQRALPAR